MSDTAKAEVQRYLQEGRDAGIGRARLHGPVITLVPAATADMDDIVGFLQQADLTLSGLDSPSVYLWIARDEITGDVFATTGYEVSADGSHALIRSVAVDSSRRGSGIGLKLARFAMDRAADSGAQQAWLFSRRSGPFWQKAGFTSAETSDLSLALASTHQVQLFTETGQLQKEMAWHRSL